MPLGELILEPPSHGDVTLIDRMLELAVAVLLDDLLSAVILQHPNVLPYLHHAFCIARDQQECTASGTGHVNGLSTYGAGRARNAQDQLGSEARADR